MTEKEKASAIRKAKNEYQKQWRREHPENVRRYSETYWLRRAMEMKESEEENAAED